MTETERYLKAATRGLWGHDRRALRTELQGHINVRLQELRLAGLTATEAERQTLRELGAAAEVRTGMFGVHTLPKLGKGGLVGLMAATLLVTTLPRSQAQVSIIFGSSQLAIDTAYLDFQQLQREVGKVGGTLTGTAERATLSLPGIAPTVLPPVGWAAETFKERGQMYVSTRSVVASLLSKRADIRLSGWSNLTMQVGKTKLHLQTTDERIAQSLYTATLWPNRDLTGQVPLALPLLHPGVDTQRFTLTGGVQDGQVYALVVPVFRSWWALIGGQEQTCNMNFSISTAVARGGQVTFEGAKGAEPFALQPSVQQMHRVIAPYLKSGEVSTWNTQRPAPAVLLKLSGHFGNDAYTVVSPKELQRQSTPGPGAP